MKTTLGGPTAWTKRNKGSGEFMAVKNPVKKTMATKKFKGVRMDSAANDDRSPLLDLITCINCIAVMRLERVDPDDGGNDLIRYRCKLCDRTEVLRLFRRAR